MSTCTTTVPCGLGVQRFSLSFFPRVGYSALYMAAFDLPANDPRLSAIFHHDPEGMRSAIERARVASTSMPPTPISEPDPERFVDFISSVPPIVTCLLVELAPFLSRLRWALQVVSWRTGSYPDSWLALAAFWAICLWLSFTVR